MDGHRLTAALVVAVGLVTAGAPTPTGARIHAVDAGSAEAVAPAAAWTGWRSSPTDASVRLAPMGATQQAPTVELDISTAAVAQTWSGVGAALTDASAGILQTSSAARSLLFDAGREDGAHLNLVRLPLSATDFSTHSWTFGWNDSTTQLTATTQAEASATLITDQLLPLRSDLRVVAVPWTAPAAMKDSNALNGGSLKATSVAAYGRMLIAQADWLQARGLPLHAMSLGNEPFHSSSGYPTMLMSDAQMVSLAQQVGPELGRRGVQLWSVDHNWEHRSHYDTIHSAAPQAFAASAFHCYGGSPAQMAGVAVPPIVTECTGTDDGFVGTFRWDMQNLVVGAIDAGSTGLLMWNLALDESHGPHIGGCGNCRGVVDVHSQTGALTPGPEFYTLAHLARAADPGGQVIGSAPAPGIPYAAFRNGDGDVAVVGHNDSGTSQVVAVRVDGADVGAAFEIGPGDLFTIRGGAESGGTVTNLSLPALGGTTRVGKTLVVTAGRWEPADALVSYQWLRDGSPITGAEASAYSLRPEDVGSVISVRVTATYPGLAEAVAETGTTSPVRVGRLQVLATGRLRGWLRVGSRLAVAGLVTRPATSVTYRWRRNGTPVRGRAGRRARYLVVRADRGKSLSVRMILRAPGYAPLTQVLRARRLVTDRAGS